MASFPLHSGQCCSIFLVWNSVAIVVTFLDERAGAEEDHCEVQGQERDHHDPGECSQFSQDGIDISASTGNSAIAGVPWSVNHMHATTS